MCTRKTNISAYVYVSACVYVAAAISVMLTSLYAYALVKSNLFLFSKIMKCNSRELYVAMWGKKL